MPLPLRSNAGSAKKMPGWEDSGGTDSGPGRRGGLENNVAAACRCAAASRRRLMCEPPVPSVIVKTS